MYGKFTFQKNINILMEQKSRPFFERSSFNPRRNSLTFGTGVLMCLFGVNEIIWDMYSRGPRCACLESEI